MENFIRVRKLMRQLIISQGGGSNPVPGIREFDIINKLHIKVFKSYKSYCFFERIGMRLSPIAKYQIYNMDSHLDKAQVILDNLDPNITSLFSILEQDQQILISFLSTLV